MQNQDQKPGAFKRLFSSKSQTATTPVDAPATAEKNTEQTRAQASTPDSANSPYPESSNPASVDDGLQQSRDNFRNKFSQIFKKSFDLNDDLFEELEDLLIAADVGVDASLELIESLRERVKIDKITDAEGVITALSGLVESALKKAEQRSLFKRITATNEDLGIPYIMLVVGVNGVGKTTSIAKIAHRLHSDGKSVVLAAADTFRAAAVKQLQTWGERLDIQVVAHQQGADAAAVVHDAVSAAFAQHRNVLLIDTAGRLHTQSDLMEQLEKVLRVIKKFYPEGPHEVIQVLDASTGQNALNQVKHFQQAVGVNSLVLTKLDGSAKGGVALALTKQFGLPIRFVGIGEAFDDLRPFSATEFASALLPATLLDS